VLVDRVILLDKGKIVIDDSKNKVSELLKNK
jgi:ABC-type Na+ transport system ATPase subunit NatA